MPASVILAGLPVPAMRQRKVLNETKKENLGFRMGHDRHQTCLMPS